MDLQNLNKEVYSLTDTSKLFIYNVIFDTNKNINPNGLKNIPYVNYLELLCTNFTNKEFYKKLRDNKGRTEQNTSTEIKSQFSEINSRRMLRVRPIKSLNYILRSFKSEYLEKILENGPTKYNILSINNVLGSMSFLSYLIDFTINISVIIFNIVKNNTNRHKVLKDQWLRKGGAILSDLYWGCSYLFSLLIKLNKLNLSSHILGSILVPGMFLICAVLDIFNEINDWDKQQKLYNKSLNILKNFNLYEYIKTANDKIEKESNRSKLKLASSCFLLLPNLIMSSIQVIISLASLSTATTPATAIPTFVIGLS